MSARALLLAVLLAAAPGLAGCLGFGDDDEDTNATDGTNDTDVNDTNGTDDNGTDVNDTNDTNETDTNDTNETNGNETGNDTATATWTTENRTGSISGVGLLLLGGSAEEAFTLPNGTSVLTLNLTASGGDIDLCLMGPSTEDGCEAEATAADGENASITLETPEEGEWIAELTVSGLLLPSADYELIIAYLAPAAGNETAEDDSSAAPS